MFKLEFNGMQASLLTMEGEHIYRFESKEQAKQLIDDAKAIVVTYNRGARRNEIENTEANRQCLKLVFDGFFYSEL